MTRISLVFVFLFLFVGLDALLGQCTDAFVENKKNGDIHYLSTKKQIITTEGNFIYNIEFKNSGDGLTAIVTRFGLFTEEIKPLKKEDKIMFISSDGDKKPYDFITDFKPLGLDNQTYSAVLQLDLDAIKWLSKNTITSIRLVNMLQMKMYPQTLSKEHQNQLSELTKCFELELDPSMVKDKNINNSLASPTNKNNKSKLLSEDKTDETDENSKWKGSRKTIDNLDTHISTDENATNKYFKDPLFQQSCKDQFAKNIIIGENQSLVTKSQFLVTRPDYDYSIEFMTSEEGITAIITTTGHNTSLLKRLEKNDKLMFISSKGDKRPFDFMYEGEKTTVKGRAAYVNILRLDLNALKWLAENDVTDIRLVDMVGMKMFPYSLGERQAALKQLAQCFLSELDVSLLKKNSLNKSQTSSTTNTNTTNKKEADNFTKNSNTSTDNSNSSSSEIRGVAHLEKELHNNNTPQLWELSDMTLSPEAAAKKYLSLLENTLAEQPDQASKETTLNTKIGLAFFEQKQFGKAIPYFQKALKTLLDSKDGAAKKAQIESMLASIYVNKELYQLAAGHNKEALDYWKNASADSLGLELSFRAYLNQAVIFQQLDTAANNTNWYVGGSSSEQKDWKAELKKRGILPIVSNTQSEKNEELNLALLSIHNAQKLIPQFPSKEQTSKKVEVFMALGRLYFEANLLEESKKNYNAALDLGKRSYDKNHPTLAEATRMLAEIALAERSYEIALAYANEVLKNVAVDEALVKNMDKLSSPIEVLNAITTKGIITYENKQKGTTENDLKKILADYEIASKMLLEMRKTHRNEGADYQLEKTTDKLSQHAVVVCNKLHKITKKEDYLDQAFDFAELSKSGLMYEITQDLKSAAGIPKEEIEKENGLKSQLAYLKSQVFYEMQQGDSKDEARLQKLQEAIAIVNKDHQKLLEHFEKKYPQYYALKYNHKTIKVGDLQKVLASNEVFLEYVATDSFIYVLAISSTEIKSQFTNLTTPLSKTVKTLQFALKRMRSDWYEHYGNELYKAVIGDLAPFIKNKKLIIAPDAELHYIPFGVLPTTRIKTQGTETKIYTETRYLIEDHAICYNHSASAFVNSKYQQHRRSNHQLATWAPHFESMFEIIKAKGLGETLAPLPEAEKEAKLIAALFGNQAHVANAASEAKFKASAGLYSILHLATHGILNDVVPLSSSLVLSNEGIEDGLLNASELYEMSLSANMAVLSACNSGMGKLSKAEGVIGVASGFAYAGVPNIVMSKWSVSDWSTSVLMKSFYENLKKGMPKDVALQQAKISYINDMRAKGKEKLLAPFFWGSFVLSGNTEPIDSISPMKVNYWWLGLVVLIIGGLILFWKRRKTIS